VVWGSEERDEVGESAGGEWISVDSYLVPFFLSFFLFLQRAPRGAVSGLCPSSEPRDRGRVNHFLKSSLLTRVIQAIGELSITSQTPCHRYRYRSQLSHGETCHQHECM